MHMLYVAYTSTESKWSKFKTITIAWSIIHSHVDCGGQFSVGNPCSVAVWPNDFSLDKISSDYALTSSWICVICSGWETLNNEEAVTRHSAPPGQLSGGELWSTRGYIIYNYYPLPRLSHQPRPQCKKLSIVLIDVDVGSVSYAQLMFKFLVGQPKL